MTNKLTQSEEFLWNYISRHFQNIPNLTISELAEITNVSNATVVRTLKKKGYSGYSDFKHDIETKSREHLNIMNNTDISKATRQSIMKNFQEVTRTLNMLDFEHLEQSIAQIEKSERVIVFARGFSELIATEVKVKLQLLGKYCEVHTDPNIIRPISQRLTQQDIVLFISLNGETNALVSAARNCKNIGVQSILIGASGNSSLAQLVTYKLIGFKAELSYFPDFEVHSRLPLSIMSRILLDTYAATLNN